MGERNGDWEELAPACRHDQAERQVEEFYFISKAPWEGEAMKGSKQRKTQQALSIIKHHLHLEPSVKAGCREPDYKKSEDPGST